MFFYGLGVDYKKAAMRLIGVFQYSLDSTVQILAFLVKNTMISDFVTQSFSSIKCF